MPDWGQRDQCRRILKMLNCLLGLSRTREAYGQTHAGSLTEAVLHLAMVIDIRFEDEAERPENWGPSESAYESTPAGRDDGLDP